MKEEDVIVGLGQNLHLIAKVHDVHVVPACSGHCGHRVQAKPPSVVCMQGV